MVLAHQIDNVECRGDYYMSKRDMVGTIIFYSIVALSMIAILLAIMPWYSSFLQHKSLEQAENGYQVEALHAAESAVSYNPFSIQALFILAGDQQRIGRVEEARSTLMMATELQPLNYATWEQLALYERDRWHEPESARAHFEKAASLNPLDKYLGKEAGVIDEQLS